MATRSSQLLAGLTGILSACLAIALGWFLGAAALSGVEPGGQFVSCGPALFGRPDPLPHPTCADAYFPLPAISVVLIAAGVVALLGCVAIGARRESAPRRAHGIHPANSQIPGRH